MFAGRLIFNLISFCWSKFFWGMEGGEGTNDRPGADHVTSGPMRGLEKTAPDGADTHTSAGPIAIGSTLTSGHGNSMT